MRESKSCSPRRLIERPPFFVDACACGTLHVSAGSVTLRMKREAARELASAVWEALAEDAAPDLRALC